MRIAIVGSRNFGDMADVASYVAGLPDGTTVISGGARGVDTAAERAARARGLAVEVHLPDYQTYGRSAPIIRNGDIVADADLVVASQNGVSPGTRNAITRARRLGKRVEIRQ